CSASCVRVQPKVKEQTNYFKRTSSGCNMQPSAEWSHHSQSVWAFRKQALDLGWVVVDTRLAKLQIEFFGRAHEIKRVATPCIRKWPNARGKPHRSAKHGGYQRQHAVGVGLTDELCQRD